MEVKKFQGHDLKNKGLNILNGLDKFIIVYDSYSTEFETFNNDILNKGYIKNSSKLDGRDSELYIVEYRKETQQEKLDKDLPYQICLLEKKFNIKISYTKNPTD